MTFAEKLYRLRRKSGLSQEELAEKLQVSRQAVSRWEMGSTLPDAKNLLQLSDLFAVSVDYLLRDEMEEETPRKEESFRQFDISLSAPVKTERNRQIGLSILIALQVLAFFWGLMGQLVLRASFVTVMAVMLHLLNIAVFEIAFHICAQDQDEEGRRYRRKYYRIAVWFFACFPIRAAVRGLAEIWWAVPSFILEAITLLIYLVVCLTVTVLLREKKRAE